MPVPGYASGLYRIYYSADGGAGRVRASALLALSGTSIIGSDANGALLSGSITPRDARGPLLRLDIGVPPGGELVTGFSAGTERATVAVTAELPAVIGAGPVVADVAGMPLAVELAYVGPLPGAPLQHSKKGSATDHDRAAPHPPRHHHRRARHSR